MEHIDIDDDFGDLYADVEVQASSAIHNVAATSQLSTEKTDIDNKEEVIVDNGSDSEDDLNILLNSDDEGIPFPVTCGGFEDDDVDDEEENVGLEDKNKKCVDQDALEHKGSYRSQYSLYKYIRSHPAAFASNSKSNGYAGAGSYSSTLERGDREDIGCNQRMRSGSLAAQRRHNFSLPRSRTILDVNIDTFERKPWRHLEADITDFFNFGFDEDSWKRYCNQLDQYRHGELISTRILTSESFKSNEAYEAGSEHETVAQEALADKIRSRHARRISPLSKSQSREEKHSDMQKGRAIQVEDSIGERKPSMDVRRPPHRDSDVIQINVQNSKDDSSGSDNEGLDPVGSAEHKSCENGDLGVDDSRENLCLSSGSEDELQRVDLDGHHGGLDMTASNKRCSQQTTACECVSTDSDNNESAQISDVDVHHYREVAFRDLEIMAETIETSKNAKEKVGRNTCITAPSILGTKLSQGKHSQHKPNPSCYATNREASRNGAYVDTEKYHNHRKKTSPNSVTELRESVTSDSYYHSRDSRSHGVKTRLGDCKYYARHRNPIEENSKHNNRRYNGVVRLKTRLDEDNTLSDNERLYDVDHSAVGHSRENGRLHGYHSYHGEDMPHCRKSDLSFSYYGERFLEYRDGAACSKNPQRKDRRSFGVETNRYFCRNSDEGEYPLEHKISRMDDVVMDRDWYQYESEPAIVDHGLLTYRESRQLDSMYSSYIDHGRGARWKRKGEESQFRNRMENVDFFPEPRYTNEKCERSVPYNKRDSDYLEYRYEGHLPYTRREVQSPGRSKRRCGSPSIDFDNLWSLSEEDEYWRVRDDVSLSSHSYKEPRTANRRRWQGTASPGNDVYERYERHGKYRRGIWTERFRDRGSFGGYTDAFDTEESTDEFDDRVYFERRHYWQSELLHWTEGQSISRHRDDKFHADSAPFSFEKTSWHKRVDAELGSAHDGKLIDDRQIQRHRDELIREGNNGNRFDRSSNVIRKGNHDQTLQRCWDSVVGEGKSSVRYPNARGGMYNGRHIDVEHKTSNDFTDGHTEKVVRVDSPKLEPDQNDEKWLDKFPVTQHSEALDIEEGQIITEEIKESTIPASHDLTRVSDVEELRDSKATDGKTAVEKKNPRILEVMAKMEKRRERFKEPIILKKDVDTTPSPKIPVDSFDETAKTKQQRPTRKRRWGGS